MSTPAQTPEFQPQYPEFEEYFPVDYDFEGDQAAAEDYSQEEAAPPEAVDLSGELSQTELDMLLDPEVGDLRKLDALLWRLHTPDGDFRQFARDECGLSTQTLYLGSDDSQEDYAGRTQNLLDVGHEYASMQRQIKGRFQDSRFDGFVNNETWDALRQRPMIDRARATGQLYNQYEELKTYADSLLGDQAFSSWLEGNNPAEVQELENAPVDQLCEWLETQHVSYQEEQAINERREAEKAAAAELKATTEAAQQAAKAAAEARAQEKDQQRQTKAESRLEEMSQDDRFSDWLKLKGEDYFVKFGSLSSAESLKILEKERRSRDYKKHLKAQTAEEAVWAEQDTSSDNATADAAVEADDQQQGSKILPGVAIKRTPSGLTINIGGQKPDVAVPSGNQAAKAVALKVAALKTAVRAAGGLTHVDPVKQATAIAMAAAFVAGGGMPDVNSDPDGKALDKAFEEMEKVSLAPGDRNPASEVTLASKIAEDRYEVFADEEIPSKLTLRLVEAGANSARTKVQTISANPTLKAAEPGDSQMDRSDVMVRRIDDLADYTVARVQGNKELTPSGVDTASEGAVKFMMAARYPESVRDLAPDFEPQNEYQAKIAKTIGQTVLASTGSYDGEQKEFMSALVAKTVDETTPEAEQEAVLKRLSDKAEEIAGMEVSVDNPKFTLAQSLAAVSIHESGSPARNIENWAGYIGPWQMSPKFWAASGNGWAETYLGDAKAPMTIDNQVMVAVKLWTHNIESSGSSRAAMATWLKGPSQGAAIAGRDRDSYNAALAKEDGNGTSISEYMNKIEGDVETVDVPKQLPFLKGVMERNPDFDWSLLEREYSLYPSLHMDDLQAAAQRQADERARAAEVAANPEARAEAGRKVTEIAYREFAKNGNKPLETEGSNTGPEVQKYTGGPSGANAPWCMWFVSYLYREAGYEFQGSPAGADGNIPAVINMSKWFQNNGIHFGPNDENISPQPGDVAMFGGDDHGGVVTKVRGTMIETIEGNTSGDGSYDADGGTVGRKVFDYKTRPGKIEFGRLKTP